jgi:uncharacterized membrane protein YedE/YeeE
MINSLFKGLVRSYLDSAIELLKIRVVMGYVSGLKAFRRLVLMWCLLVFCLMLLAVGLGLVPVLLCMLTSWTPATKTVIAVLFAAIYILAPLAILLCFFSAKRWMKVSGAEDMMANVLAKSRHTPSEEPDGD